jgi:tetratricopeptide (TPR) repeat protein
MRSITRISLPLATAVAIVGLSVVPTAARSASVERQAVQATQDPGGQQAQLDRQKQLSRLFSTGYKYYQIQDYAGAIPALKRYTELDSTNTQAWHFLATCYTQTEQWPEARQSYLEILKRDTDELVALQGLAFAYNEMGEAELHRQTYERIVQVAPDEPEFRQYLLGLYQRDNNNEGMIALLEALARRSPDDPLVHRQLAELHRREGDVEAQVASLEEAVKNDPSNPENLLRLGRIYFDKLEKPCEAARVFELLTRAVPEDPVAWRRLGRARGQCNDPDGAVAAFQKALELGPDEIRIYSELGRTLSDLGRFDEAIIWVEKALQRQPNDGYAYVTWGDILRDKGMAAADSAGNVPYESKVILETAIEKYQAALTTGSLTGEVLQYAERQVAALEPFRRTRAEIFMERARRPPPPPTSILR